MSLELRERAHVARDKGTNEDRVSVILQLKDKPGGQLKALLNRNGVHLKGHYENLAASVVELPANTLDELAETDEVLSLTHVRRWQTLGHVEAKCLLSCASVRMWRAIKAQTKIA